MQSTQLKAAVQETNVPLNLGRDMEQLRNYGDSRQTAFCAYCGRNTETRDHIPSKVFLDEPYPTNLPVVPACKTCNEGFSMDEEYVACLVECVLKGSAKPDDIKREKIRRILERKPSMVSRFDHARYDAADGPIFSVEIERVRNVVLKLARGHALFELNEPQLDDPSHVAFVPYPSMAQDVRNNFESPPTSSIWPEVGCRAMQRVVVNEPSSPVWIIAQPGRYRYITSIADGIVIRMVINEYLACEVVWNYE